MYGNGQYGRDPQCGGTDRSYYNHILNSQALVLPDQTAQALYNATHGAIWYRCGACGNEEICWPRPGFDQLLAQLPPDQRPKPGGSSAGPSQQPSGNAPGAMAQKAQQAAAALKSGWRPLKAGVAYASTGFNGQKLNAVRVTGPMTIGFRQGGARLQDLVKQAGGTVIGGVTGTFSNWGKTPLRTGGPIVQGGAMTWPEPGKLDGIPSQPRSFLGQRPDGTFFVTDIGPDPAAPGASLKGRVEALGADQGIGGLGRLMDDGRDVHASTAQKRQGFNDAQAGDGKNARAVAGVSGDGTTLYLLVEQRNDAMASGAGLGEMARILYDLGARNAVFMDGGGSAQIYIPRAGVDSRPGNARALPTGILF
jgi:hypothetical protein